MSFDIDDLERERLGGRDGMEGGRTDRWLFLNSCWQVRTACIDWRVYVGVGDVVCIAGTAVVMLTVGL